MILPGNEDRTLPIIEYDEMEGKIRITGRCIAVNVEEYFSDLLPYMTDCLIRKPMNFTVHADIEYFSTRASKVIMEFFTILKQYVKDKGFKVKVFWYYEEGDEDLKEAGEDYEDLSRLDFTFVEKEPEE